MKAIVLTAFGDVDKLELRDVAEPPLAPETIKVRVRGASINPVDWKIRSGGYRKVPIDLPMILGRDVAGEVIAVGKGITSFKVGQRVLGLIRSGYAEVVVADTNCWAEIPVGMDTVDAAALPLVLLTGAQLIEEAVKPRARETVLVTGALGGVGRAAVFAAHARGAKVWAGVRAKQKGEAEALHADGVVALDDDAEIAKLPTLDAIADTLGGDALQKVMGRVKKGGVVGSVVGEPAGAKEKGLEPRAMMAHPDAKRLGELVRAVAEGKLVIPIARKFPLAEAREAQKLAEHGGAGGKVVLVV